MIRCVIVDDEPLAREGLADYVKEVDFLQLAGICGNPVELMKLLDQQPIELIFLDIHMPKMSGIDFLKIVQKQVMVILTTAYSDYALEGFQLDVLDYLLKPITFDRFFKAANKVKDYYQLQEAAAGATGGGTERGNAAGIGGVGGSGVAEAGISAGAGSAAGASAGADYFFIRCGSKYEKIFFSDILYVEGMQNYVTIYTRKGKYLTLLNLKHLEDRLDSKSFIRVHKSYIVAIDKIESIEGNEIFIQSHRVPISRSSREQVMKQVVDNKLWDKIRFS
jgi:two-component system LytT family response regulator